MPKITINSYDETGDPNYPNVTRKPLMLASSGGGGHIAAIKGIAAYFDNRFKDEIELKEYTPVSYKNREASTIRSQIKQGIQLMHGPVGKPVRGILQVTPFPVLPDITAIEKQFLRLLPAAQENEKRKYIDMLLDIYPAGYESAAIWNVLQQEDKIQDLKKLIDLQYKSDADNYEIVYNHFFEKLKNAAENGEPFTEIVSTQAMALPALCDVAKAYNEWLRQNSEIKAPQIFIHQYMTDLPTKGAVHFFNGLSTLTSEQQQQMKLYGVGMTKEIIDHFFPDGAHFAALFDIPADNNPMVRPGFQDDTLDKSDFFDKDVTLELQDKDPNVLIPYVIRANEKIATIMLGSQGGNDSFEYIETLLKNGMSRVFVFGVQNNTLIQEKITELLEEHPEYQDQIIPVANQGDQQIAPLMTRSNLIVTRGGGLSVMEQLAMNHNPQQKIFIHHANSDKKELSSGISWEDDNVSSLIEQLGQKGVHCEKTTPKRIKRQLAEAYLNETLDASSQEEINDLPDKLLEIAAETLRGSPHTCSNGTDVLWAESRAKYHIEFLKNKLEEGLNYLKKTIEEEVASLEFSAVSQYLLVEGSIGAINLERYDVGTIIERFQDTVLQETSSTFKSAVEAYKTLTRLQETIESPSSEALKKFRTDYEQPNTQKALTSVSNFFEKIIEEINNYLATYFPSIKLSYQQEIKKYMSALTGEQGFFAKAKDSNKPVDPSCESENDDSEVIHLT